MNDKRRQSRWAQIRRSESDKNLLNELITESKRARSNALVALRAAQAAFEDAEAELDTMHQQEQFLSKTSLQLRNDLLRHLLDIFPEELLAIVFEEATRVPEMFMFGIIACKELASAPFRISSVCSKWRRVAIRTSRLWTFISTPDTDTKTNTKYNGCISLLLSRSARSPLHIYLNWLNVRDWDARHDLHNILQELGMHSSRWRIAEIRLPSDADSFYAVESCQVPLPKLERICLIASNPNQQKVGSHFAPIATVLHEMIVWGPNNLQFSPHVHYPSLTSLRLWYEPRFSMAWSILLAVAPHLESLLLAYEAENIGEPFQPVAPLALPKLRQLTLTDARLLVPYLPAMQLPVLRSLSLEQDLEHLVPFLNQVSVSVTSLILTGITTAADMRFLSTLHNINTLMFQATAPEVTCNYTVSTGFFAQRDVWVDNNVWPKLTEIILGEGGQLYGNANIVAFVQWRTIDLDVGNRGSESPQRLRTFSLHADVGISELSRLQIQQLLAAGQ